MSEFLSMGGYGLYVWGSFGVTAVVMAVNAVMAYRRLGEVKQRARLRVDAARAAGVTQ